MNELITKVTPQPDFPHEDLNDDNAAWFELLLQSEKFITEQHSGAESFPVYRIGHGLMRSASGRFIDETMHQIAVDHGIRMYEATAAAVESEHAALQLTILATNAAAYRASGSSTFQIRNYMFAAHEAFREKMPRTDTVVREGVARYAKELGEYASFGAAIAWQFELDTTGEVE